MRVQRIHSTSQQMKLSPASLDCLTRTETSSKSYMLGDISHDGSYGWLARGSFLEVFWMQTGQRLAAWCFGALLKEPSTSITAVCECRFDKGSKLVVATSTVNSEGLICLFDAKNCSIMKAIEVPFEVTSLEVVSTVSQRQSQSVVLSDLLKHFCGVLAVGTQCGHVYLIDLCLDDDVDGCDELSPNTLLHVDHVVKDAISKRYTALARGKHFCLELGEGAHVRGYYTYSKPDNTTVKSFSAGNVCVSCLKFVRQTGLLVVGFSFGCFQFWRLQETALEYSSRFEENLPPVTHVSFQEPENDPRNFCYLWVAKGPMASQSAEEHTSVITLFQLGYSKKTWYDDFGYLFEELTSVGPRFEHCLTADPYNSTPARDEGSRVVSCYTVQDPNYQLGANRSEDAFEGSSGPDLSLCVIVWEAAPSDPHAKPPAYVSLFDMNRWYHAQMPSELKIYPGSFDVCPYFAMCSLDGVQQKSGTDDIMAIHIKYNSLAKFHSGLIPEPEQHFFPSSLAFDLKCVTETGLVHAKYLGVQRQILNDLLLRGPPALIDPHDMFTLCQHSGLLPKTEVSARSLPATYKREALLSMALDHNLTGFINSCVAHWASGEFSSAGCTLRFILEWAWRKVAAKKETIDRLCVSLFDWSGIYLDQQTLALLHQHHRALEALASTISTIMAQSTITTEQGAAELQSKHKVVGLLAEHIGLILWFYEAGLLPEHSDEDLEENNFVYPAKALGDFYTKRRADLHLLHSDVKSQDVLLIDALTAHLGSPLHNLWEKEGGSGQYPPPSIHALLNLCLLENVEQQDRHVMIFYLLCDLLNSAPEGKQAGFNDKVRNFTQTYNLPLGLSKLIQGMWLLDHKDFEDSLFYLLDPSVQQQLSPWQHTCILKSLLYQGKHQLAQQYLKVRRPPLTCPEDVKLKLTVLLANGLTAEAFDYQRISRDKNNVQDLLSHVFLGCQQTKAVDQLLLLPFSDEEERHLVSYMKTSSDTHSQELLVLYYLLRARYVEAFRLNNRIKQQAMSELDPKARERARVRNSLVEGYYKVLPSIQRKLCFGPDRPIQQQMGHRREVPRPAPLSTIVNKADAGQMLTRAALLQSVLDKVMEVKYEDEEPQPQEQTSRLEDSPSQRDVPGPFICTPMTPQVHKEARLSEVVFPMNMSSNRLQPPELLLPSGRSPQGGHSPYRSRPPGVVSPLNMSRFGSALKRKQHMSSEALSLLRTPPVKRKTPCKDALKPANNISTPHSILKVRSKTVLPQRSPSPPPVGKLNFQSDLAMPTPPRIQRRVTMGANVKDDTIIAEPPKESPPAQTAKVEQVTTSKHLRFASTSPPDEVVTRPSTEVQRSVTETTGIFPRVTGRKSLRDRSPTPERQSPMMAAQTDQVADDQVTDDQLGDSDGQEQMEVQQVDSEEEMVVVDNEVTLNFSKAKDEIEIGDADEADTEEFDLISQSRVVPERAHESEPNDIPESSQDAEEDMMEDDEQPDVISLHSESDKESKTADSESPASDGDGDDDLHLQLDVQDDNVTESEPEEAGRVTPISNSVQTGLDTVDKAESVAESKSTFERTSPNTSHEKIVSKNVHEEGHTDQEVKEYSSPHAIRQVVETTTFKKTISETIKILDADTDSDMAEVDSSEPNEPMEQAVTTTRSTPEMTTPTRTTPEKSVYKPKEIPRVETEMHAADSTSQSLDDVDNMEVGPKKGSRSVQRSGSRRGRKTSESLPMTPTRRSSRVASKTMREKAEEETVSQQDLAAGPAPCHGHGHAQVTLSPGGATRRRTSPRVRTTHRAYCSMCSAAKDIAFKTPPRPSKMPNLPPTPPKSNASSPASSTTYHEQEPATSSLDVRPQTNGRRSTTRSRSRSKSPTSTTEVELNVTQIKPRRGRPPKSPTRAASPGPLSENSFMMKLRKNRKSISRETTPESTRTVSDVHSHFSDDFEKPDFTFSNPLAVSDTQSHEEVLNPSTPVHPFIFSPPITRSRRRESLMSLKSADTSLNTSTTGDTSLVQSPAKITRAKKREKPVKQVEHHASPSNSPVSLLSPIKESEIPQRVTRQKAKVQAATKQKTLRPRLGSDKKRKPIPW